MRLVDHPTPERLAKRFWSKVQKSDGCWTWLASRTRNGYGKFGLQKAVGWRHAHRVAYMLAHGEVPDDKAVCHTCDNPPCVNPAHLFLGTQTENLDDMTRKGRRRYKSHQGEKNGRAKLSQADVDQIRFLHSQGTKRIDLAAQFHVCYNTIDRIIHGILWPSIPKAEEKS